MCHDTSWRKNIYRFERTVFKYFNIFSNLVIGPNNGRAEFKRMENNFGFDDLDYYFSILSIMANSRELEFA